MIRSTAFTAALSAASGCQVEDCPPPHQFKLSTQQQRGRNLRPIEVPERHTMCAVPDCGKPPLSMGWCPGHYTQEREGPTHDPAAPGRPGRGCAVPGCDGKHYAHGLCHAHAARLAVTE